MAASGASLPLGERELTEIERLRGGRKPERYPLRGRHRALRPRALPRDLQPPRPERDRPCLRAQRALARRVAAGGLRPRRRAQDGPRPDGDLPGPRAACRRGLLDGQRGRGLQRRGALDRDRHAPRIRPLRRSDGPPRAPLGAQPALHPRRRHHRGMGAVQRVRRAGAASAASRRRGANTVSHASATCNVNASAPRAAITCRPIGRPSSS